MRAVVLFVVLCAVVAEHITQARDIRVGTTITKKVPKGINLDTINIDTLVDAMLVELRADVVEDGLDPYPIVDEEVLDFIYIEGTLSGLSTLNRTGEATLKIADDGTLTIKAELGISNFDVFFDLYTEILPLEATADGTVSEVTARFTAEGTLSTNITVTEFDIDDIENCDITIVGLGIFDYLVDEITTDLCNLLEGVIAYLIDGPIEDLINQLLGDLFNGDHIDLRRVLRLLNHSKH